MSIAFIDLQAQRKRIETEIDAAIHTVLRHGAYVMGPEVRDFEAKLADFGQAKHALGCANGTDALALVLMAWGLRTGDAVFCPSFTFVATGELIPWLGASPVFVDIDPVTYNIDPAHLEASIEATLAAGTLRPRAIIAVDLFGQPADYPALAAIAKKYDLKLISDSAQGFGCTLNGAHPIHWADVTTTSFFPAKPLGCYGDGGAILTDDDALAELIDSLRIHGKATDTDKAGANFDHDPKYWNMRIGMNSRLDTLQAAILLEKLAIFPSEIDSRNDIARRYNDRLAPHVAKVPAFIDGHVSNWAQYTIEHDERDSLIAHLRAHDVPSAVYYPMPIHTQAAYGRFPTGPGGLPHTEAAAARVLSLPMHPYLNEETQDRVIAAVASFEP
ncbi:MAG: DegT/DnrJ/EryC1/StrS aminotransferase family protein [Pseudomonadota bacterium]